MFMGNPFHSGSPLAISSAQELAAPLNQSWIHVAGSCNAAQEGAVLGLPSTGCGGNTTSFDSQQIYGPAVIKDIASAAAPCPGIEDGQVCYRMWYVGEDSKNIPRIGLAVSPDGRTWTRVPGSGSGGSTLDLGVANSFDSNGVAYLSVMKDAGIFKIWYSGYGNDYGLDLTEGIGYATSTDGRTWTRISGPLKGGAVLRASAVANAFDEHEAYVPFVIKDLATASMPCANVAQGEPCYRMWYEGANTRSGYRFLLGYATSADGIRWTRVTGPGSGASVLDSSMGPSFDDNSVGIAQLIKEGSFLRMWYEAKNYNPGAFSIGHVSSSDGLNWIRPTPNEPVFTGADDPATPDPDYIWSHSVLKDGISYHMWYALTIQPASDRISYALMTPGTSMQSAVSTSGNSFELGFTTTQAIPAGGSVLVTLPPGLDLVPGSSPSISGFGNGATVGLEQAAITDAAAAQVARSAIVIRLEAAEPAGKKSVAFSIADTTKLPAQAIIQSFNQQDVLEYSLVELPTVVYLTPTMTSTPTSTATASSTATATATVTSTSTTTATASSTLTATVTASSTVTATPTNTLSPSNTPTGTPTLTSTLTQTVTASHTPTVSSTPSPSSTLIPTSLPPDELPYNNMLPLVRKG